MPKLNYCKMQKKEPNSNSVINYFSILKQFSKLYKHIFSAVSVIHNFSSL